MGNKRGLLPRIAELATSILLTLVVLIGGFCFTYSAFRSSTKLTGYQGIVEQTKLVGKGRKWFVFTLRGLPFGLSTFHTNQDYDKLLRGLAAGDTVVTYYNGSYPAQGSPTATITATTKEVWRLTKGNQELISLADKQTKEGLLGICLLVVGLGMAWGTQRALCKG